MCIAIVKPTGVRLGKPILETCWERNPDGAGFMWAYNNHLHVLKGYDKFDEFYNDYNKVSESKLNESAIVLHFRIATSGNIDYDNCHPHYVNRNMAFVHNGIIDRFSDIEADKSDTVFFNENILHKLPANFLSIELIMELISGYIGNSKLVFMDNKGNITIVNEEEGIWDMGCWFSNNSYIPSRVPVVREGKRKYIYENFDYYQNSSIVRQLSNTCPCGIRLVTQKELSTGICNFCSNNMK